MMQVTFLAHSGFLVELPSVTLLFDWWKGDLPPLPEKPLLVFASHRHEDHLNPAIFALDDGTRDVRFLLGSDIKLSPRHLAQWGLDEAQAAHCLSLRGEESAAPLAGVTVETLFSTDEGVAFLVTADNTALYHAGDLHWWHWAEESTAWNRNMEVDFKRFSAPLKGRELDLAMVPLDPRLGDAYAWGLTAFLEETHTRHVLPMHQWGDFPLTERFCREFPQLADPIVPIVREGQTFTF